MTREQRGVVFADIDGTLIGPRRDVGRAHNDTSTHEVDDVGATDANGNVIAWRTSEQRALYSWLQQVGDVVAVTGRSVGAYGRVRLPFAPHAIVHHGAVILGSEGEAFRAATRPLLLESAPVLREAHAGLLALIATQPSLRVTTQTVEGQLVEVCVKHRDPNLDRGTIAGRELPSVVADDIEGLWRALPDVRVHRNGNNLAVLPRRVTKARAVLWLREHVYTDIDIAFGAGDSVSDYGFMAACDVALVPTKSQLDRRLLSLTVDDDNTGNRSRRD